MPPDCEYKYDAPVIKETEFRLDGVLTPVCEDLPLIFLEAQMQRDLDFYGGYFAEIFLYLYQYKIKSSWLGLLILNNRQGEESETIKPRLNTLSVEQLELFGESLFDFNCFEDVCA